MPDAPSTTPDLAGDGAVAVGLPPLLNARRRRWLLALLANGVGRALMAATGVVLLRWALSGPGGQLPLPGLLAALAGGVLVSAWLMRRETLDAEALAQHYIAHVRLRLFDRDRDGRLTLAEVPDSYHPLFVRVDKDRDGVLTRLELEAMEAMP